MNSSNIPIKQEKNELILEIGKEYRAKLIYKAARRSGTKNSLLKWFCRQIEGRELVLRYQDYENIEYDDGVGGETEDVVVIKMVKGIWCEVSGEIVCPRMEFSEFGRYRCPKYENEQIQCVLQTVC